MKRQIMYNLLNAKTKSNFLCLPYTKQRHFLQKKELSKEKREWWVEKKKKEGFLIALATGIKKEPTESIRKPANEWKVYEKPVRTEIKQDLS